MKGPIIALVAATLTAGSFGTAWAGVTYLEQLTPAGQVAPLNPSPGTEARPYRNTNPGSSEFPREHQDQAAALVSPLMDDAIVGTFQAAYRAQNSPRLLVFLNRSLSDEVREWRTYRRAVIAMKNLPGTPPAAPGEQNDSAGIAVYGQQHVEETARRDPADEGWMWGFEDAFVNAFLEAGTKIVDRALVMRLAAADSGDQGDAFSPLAVKKIEIDSMRGSADLYLEILVRRQPSSPLGYEFKASAKEIATGFVKAHVTTRNWDYQSDDRPAEKVVATERGYEIVPDLSEDELPAVEIVARDLALALMRSLTSTWSL